MADIQKQNFVIARLADYCRYDQSFERSGIRDPISYLWNKLGEVDEPLTDLKQELYADSTRTFFGRLARGELRESELPDYLQFLDNTLSRGDYADAAFHLDWANLQDTGRRQEAVEFLQNLRAYSRLEEEIKPLEHRNKVWERLVSDIYKRLGFDGVEKCHAHKPLTARRLRFMLRRMRFHSADFCAVFRFPVNEGDTFTPFILPRVEGLIAANRRMLKILRTR